MKKIIFSLTLFLFVLDLFSQDSTNFKHSRDHYLKKSKNQKTVANVFLAGGAACILTSLLIPKGEELAPSGFIYDRQYKNENIKSTFGGIGFLFILTSIPIYLASSKNKHKAMRATTINFNNQKIYFLKQNSYVFKMQPSFTLKIGL